MSVLSNSRVRHGPRHGSRDVFIYVNRSFIRIIFISNKDEGKKSLHLFINGVLGSRMCADSTLDLCPLVVPSVRESGRETTEGLSTRRMTGSKYV